MSDALSLRSGTAAAPSYSWVLESDAFEASDHKFGMANSEKWTLSRSGRIVDLEQYLAEDQIKFSRKFMSTYKRALRKVPVWQSPGHRPICSMCNELNPDGLTSLRKSGQWSREYCQSTYRSWAYMLALYYECTYCGVVIDFIRARLLHGAGSALTIQRAFIGLRLRPLMWLQSSQDAVVVDKEDRLWVIELQIAVNEDGLDTINDSRTTLCSGLLSTRLQHRTTEARVALNATDSHAHVPQLTSWVLACEDHVNCSDYVRGGSYELVGLMLIDVNDMRLVQSTKLHQAAALSYVWVPHDEMPVRLLKENLALLKSVRGLETIGRLLPRTIREAIDVCRVMSIPFLWCDALCIIQDDHNDLRRQMSMMQYIYKYSYLTLVCAYGKDVQARLPRSPAHTYRRTSTEPSNR